MSLRSALKHRFLSFGVKSAASIVFPISIARAYGANANGELQLLIAATGYLSLLDSGMTISAINSAGDSGVDSPSRLTSKLESQNQSSRKISIISIIVSAAILFWATSSNFLEYSLLPAALLLATVSTLEIAFTPYKYHLYSLGKAALAESREARFSFMATATLLALSALVLLGFIGPILGVAMGALLLRIDQVASGFSSFIDLRRLARRTKTSPTLDAASANAIPYKTLISDNFNGFSRAWISALQVLALLNWSSDLFIIRILIGASTVSDYAILSKIFMIPATLMALSGPVIQSAAARGRLNADMFGQLFRRSWLLILILPLVLASISALLFSHFPYAFLWLGLTDSPRPILLLAFGFLSVLSIFSSFYGAVANAFSLFRFQVVTASLLLAANILLSWLLAVPCKLDAAGVVGATAIAMACGPCLIMPTKILEQLRTRQAQSTPRPLPSVS